MNTNIVSCIAVHVQDAWSSRGVKPLPLRYRKHVVIDKERFICVVVVAKVPYTNDNETT